MNLSMTLLDPTSERAPVARALTARPASLDGLAVALLDISKARGNVLLDRLAELLTARGLRELTRVSTVLQQHHVRTLLTSK